VEFFRREKVLNAANLLTMLRIAMLPAIVWRFRLGDSMGALILYGLAMLTDAVDGWVARRYQQVTALGKLLDPVSDKLCLLTLLALFVSDGQIPVWLFAIVLVKEAILVAGSLYALSRGVVVFALPIGKATTASFVGSVVFRFLKWRMVADALLGLSLLLSVIALIWYGILFFRKMHVQCRSYPINSITRPLS